MNRYSIHTFGGQFLCQAVEAPNAEVALVQAAQNDLTRFDGSVRPERERLFQVGAAYIVSDERGPQNTGRVQVLRLAEAHPPTPAFMVVRW